MRESKKAVVDIDGILWCMSNSWSKIISRDYPNCPLPTGKGHAWKFYEGYMTEEQMQETVLEIHMRQPEFMSFHDAGKITKALIKKGYHVTIASHRDPRAYAPTRKWLDLRDIPYDDLYIGFDKHFLLDEAEVFIDDSPFSQQVAIDMGVPNVFSIKYDYNEHVKGVHFYPDFFSLAFAISYWLSTGEQAYDRKERARPGGFNTERV
jgi:hypothetical protein